VETPQQVGSQVRYAIRWLTPPRHGIDVYEVCGHRVVGETVVLVLTNVGWVAESSRLAGFLARGEQ
jgi:hypothetical protein